MPSLPDGSSACMSNVVWRAESIHPVATGRAAEIVHAHRAPQQLEFYSGYKRCRDSIDGRWFCPFVQRVWIALEEGKLPYQYKEVNPYKKEVPLPLKLHLILAILSSNQSQRSRTGSHPRRDIDFFLEFSWRRQNPLRKLHHRRIPLGPIRPQPSSQRPLRTRQR